MELNLPVNLKVVFMKMTTAAIYQNHIFQPQSERKINIVWEFSVKVSRFILMPKEKNVLLTFKMRELISLINYAFECIQNKIGNKCIEQCFSNFFETKPKKYTATENIKKRVCINDVSPRYHVYFL